jgi:acyl phosphate:glycerol-3-phosphate acyltransferase
MWWDQTVEFTFDLKQFLGALIIGYLLGSIPFGLLITRAAGLGDIRNIGSGNIGATNVLRTGRKGLAAATLFLDGFKGMAAVFIAGAAAGPIASVAAGCAAFAGHVYPVWLGFKGGKGVATFFGILIAFAWPIGLLAGATWIATAFATRYSSLAALVAAALAPVYFAVFGLYWLIIPAAICTALIYWRHRENIGRLLKRTEPRIGDKPPAPSEPLSAPSH